MGDGTEGSSSSVALSSVIDLLSEWSALPNAPCCCPTLSQRIVHIDRCQCSIPIVVSPGDSEKGFVIVVQPQSQVKITHLRLIFEDLPKKQCHYEFATRTFLFTSSPSRLVSLCWKGVKQKWKGETTKICRQQQPSMLISWSKCWVAKLLFPCLDCVPYWIQIFYFISSHFMQTTNWVTGSFITGCHSCDVSPRGKLTQPKSDEGRF